MALVGGKMVLVGSKMAFGVERDLDHGTALCRSRMPSRNNPRCRWRAASLGTAVCTECPWERLCTQNVRGNGCACGQETGGDLALGGGVKWRWVAAPYRWLAV